MTFDTVHPAHLLFLTVMSPIFTAQSRFVRSGLPMLLLEVLCRQSYEMRDEQSYGG